MRGAAAALGAVVAWVVAGCAAEVVQTRTEIVEESAELPNSEALTATAVVETRGGAAVLVVSPATAKRCSLERFQVTTGAAGTQRERMSYTQVPCQENRFAKLPVTVVIAAGGDDQELGTQVTEPSSGSYAPVTLPLPPAQLSRCAAGCRFLVRIAPEGAGLLRSEVTLASQSVAGLPEAVAAAQAMASDGGEGSSGPPNAGTGAAAPGGGINAGAAIDPSMAAAGVTGGEDAGAPASGEEPEIESGERAGAAAGDTSTGVRAAAPEPGERAGPGVADTAPEPAGPGATGTGLEPGPGATDTAPEPAISDAAPAGETEAEPAEPASPAARDPLAGRLAAAAAATPLDIDAAKELLREATTETGAPRAAVAREAGTLACRVCGAAPATSAAYEVAFRTVLGDGSTDAWPCSEEETNAVWTRFKRYFDNEVEIRADFDGAYAYLRRWDQLLGRYGTIARTVGADKAVDKLDAMLLEVRRAIRKLPEEDRCGSEAQRAWSCDRACFVKLQKREQACARRDDDACRAELQADRARCIECCAGGGRGCKRDAPFVCHAPGEAAPAHDSEDDNESDTAATRWIILPPRIDAEIDDELASSIRDVFVGELDLVGLAVTDRGEIDRHARHAGLKRRQVHRKLGALGEPAGAAHVLAFSVERQQKGVLTIELRRWDATTGTEETLSETARGTDVLDVLRVLLGDILSP